MIQNAWKFIVWTLLGSIAATETNGQDLFRNRVAPLLERRCLSCHNDDKQEGGFSLETAETAMEDEYIEPGEPEDSHLLDLITPENGKAAMPRGSDPLTDAEVALIREWISKGAKWPVDHRLSETAVTDFDWWSFQPLRRPPIPKSEDPWIQTPIDAFILEKMNEKSLTHTKEADRRTLIRRLSFDLTGLPPTPDETNAFINDSDPKAYENLVDRLLASPHYGEHWARHWLDVVKYADTCGYDKDKLRPNAWPYRDYVIRSFNNDKPYSQFVEEQIAGDALFPGQADGIVGLGFIAAGPWDFIGHVEVPESKIDGKVARNLDRDDMVSNVMNTFCSMTIQCARCHNHKFDPFTQQHYYGLQAIFAAIDRADRPYDLDPDVVRSRNRLNEELKDFKAALARIENRINTAGGGQLRLLRNQISELKKNSVVSKGPAFGYHSAIASSQDSKKWVQITLEEGIDLEKVVLHACHDNFNGIGAGFGFPVRFKVEVATTSDPKETDWLTITDHTERDYVNPALRPVQIDFDRRKVLGDETPERVDEQKIHCIRVTATKLAERQGDYIFALAEIELFEASPQDVGDQRVQNSEVNIRFNNEKDHSRRLNLDGATITALDSIEAPIRWRKANLVDGKWATTRGPKDDSNKEEHLNELTSRLDQMVDEISTPDEKRARAKLLEEIARAEASRKSLPKAKMVYAAATDFASEGQFKPTGGTPRSIKVLLRGDVEQLGDDVGPGVLPLSKHDSWMLETSLSDSQRRSSLAKWLTRPDHPLVWRSIVNRVWQYHFGAGIVATPNDFGRMGSKPTHPELLDWLACEFRDEQSFKRLHRMIVTSSVYRQAANYESENSKIDGSNQFLWRMNRRRLTAEEIRDSILSVSGALDKSAGGPGYYLFKLERPEHSPHYEYHKFDARDPASHRRSIYRFIVRSQPNPWMSTLDCADSSQSTPKRNETLTSLQALSLLNNQFNLVMAEKFAARLQSKSKDLDQQVDLAIRWALQRDTSPEERDAFVRYAREHGLSNLCRFVFNLSEFVFVD